VLASLSLSEWQQNMQSFNSKHFMYSLFHNIDGGLIFASDQYGKLYYFYLNSIASSKANLPVLNFHISKNAAINHISLPFNYQNHNLMGLSLGLSGGVALFDIKQGEKIMQLKDIKCS